MTPMKSRGAWAAVLPGAGLVTALALGLAGCAVVHPAIEPSSSRTPTPSPSPSMSTSPAPTTSSTPPAAPALETADVLIQDATWDTGTATLTVLAFVTDLTEDGGSCTVSASGPGGSTVTSTVEAYADASVTYCSRMELSGSSFAAGTWSVTVSYQSSTSAGVSDPRTVLIR